MVSLDYSMLGPLRVQRAGERLDLGSRKQRALLALLLANRRRVVSTDGIVMALWGADATEARRRDVYVYVSRLRKVLRDGAAPTRQALRREAGGYVLDVPEESVDADRFLKLLEEARRLSPSDAASAALVLSEALALWEGEALQEFAGDGFAAAEIARLGEAHLAALELRIRADMAWKDTKGLIPEIQALVRRHPLRPELTASLMIALYRRGRQAEALEAYRRLADALGELGLEPPAELVVLEEQILLDEPIGTGGATAVVPSTFPEPIAAFVGRRQELADLEDLVEAHRLVTITGAGGLGKTSLAVELGRRLALRYDDGVLADLTQVEGTGDVVGAVADALRAPVDGGGRLDALVSRLRTRRVLIVLDNCEALRADAADAATVLLERIPGLRILATSRVRLGVAGERVYELGPLDTMPGGEAHTLLRDRIGLLGDAVVGATDEQDLAMLTEKTAGFPLLIELAAAQLRAFSAKEVGAALDEPLVALEAPDRRGPVRHRDLRANIAWSERLLLPETAVLLRRLAIFRTSFSFEAAERVAGFSPLDGGGIRLALRRLTDASLLIADRGARTRYRMLEPIRDYACIRLEEEGEAETAADRHSDYFIERFADIRRRTQTGGSLAELRPDSANLEAAIRRALEVGDASRAQRAAAEAIQFAWVAGDGAATVTLVDAALTADPAPTKARAALLHKAGPAIGLVRGRDVFYGEVIEELRSIAAALDDPEVDAWVLWREADRASWNDAPEVACSRYEQAIEAVVETGQEEEAVAVFHNYAWYLNGLPGHLDEAEAVADRWAEVADDVGFSMDLAYVDMARCWIAVSRRDHARVETLCLQTADALRRLGDHRRAATMSQPRALSALMLGDSARALGHIDTALGALDDMGLALFAVRWRFLRGLALAELGRHDEARRTLEEACNGIGDFADTEAVVTSLDVLGCALVPIAPEQAAVVLGAAAVQGAAPEPWTVVPSWAERNGDPADLLREGLGAEPYAAAVARGAAMEPSEVHAETGRLLAALDPLPVRPADS